MLVTASYSQGLKGMMYHNKTDLIPPKLSSILMHLTHFICNNFPKSSLYTLLETTDPSPIALRIKWSPLKIIWRPFPPPPSFQAEK